MTEFEQPSRAVTRNKRDIHPRRWIHKLRIRHARIIGAALLLPAALISGAVLPIETDYTVATVILIVAIGLAGIAGWLEVGIALAATILSGNLTFGVPRVAIIAGAAVAGLAVLFAFLFQHASGLRLSWLRILVALALTAVAGALMFSERSTEAAGVALYSLILAGGIVFRVPSGWALRAGLTLMIVLTPWLVVGRSDAAQNLGRAAFFCLVAGVALQAGVDESTRDPE